MIHFQGTDNKLWRANSDGSGGVNLGGYKAQSTPVAFGSSLFFQGTDDKLWKINLADGSGGVNLGGYQTKSTPFVTVDSVYFQGTDDKLWKIGLDGTGGVNLGGYETNSSPFVAGGYVFFQGTDNKLWRINLDGSGGINLGLYQTKSSPFVTGKYAYFQGTDDKLWQANLSGSSGTNLGGYKTNSPPFVTTQHVYFQGTDNKLWQVNLDGSGGTNLGGYKTKSSPTVDLTAGFIYFQVTDNALWRLNSDGSHGQHIGGFNTASTPCVNQIQTGSAIANFTVLTVVYAPPGTTGALSTSYVDYGSSNTTGTTTSLSSSFKGGFAITASLGKQEGGKGQSGEAGFSYSQTTTDGSSLDIKKTESLDIKCPGSPSDGINHDFDIIYYLWLQPQVTVTLDPENNLDWQLGIDGPVMDVQYVYVQGLKNPSSMPPGVQARLTAAGVKPSDYPSILSTNPLASGATAIDPNCFLTTTRTFPYEPPATSAINDQVPLQTYVQTSAVTNTATHQALTTYGASLGGAIGIFSLINLKGALSLEWTNTSSTATTNASSQSATVAVGGPSFGYTGPTDVQVYSDTVYNSYAFAFITGSPSFAGSINNKLGKPVAHSPITLSAGPHTFSTFTNAKGEFRFFATPAGQVKVSAAGEDFVVTAERGAKAPTILKLTKS